jgi:hypothetical protein
MAADPDRYAAWYSHKLWQLLPEVYRAADAAEVDGKGPLQEIVERIGAEAAVVRRSIDRLWEDQSIETCDDWVIGYIGDLLATNLVAGLDARGRRLDVAKTINYRRRKGTVGVLEEMATDITGWGVRVVEFFHRLARTRHSLDPSIGSPAASSDASGGLHDMQRLAGARTRTAAGGFADLRNVHGARLAGTAFDEFFYTGDTRRGRGHTGWHNVAHLGVFVWRLKSLPVEHVTPVRDKRRPNEYTFDPTGRNVPLFAAGEPPHGARWITPAAHQVPGPISPQLLSDAFLDLYAVEAPRSLAVHHWPPGAADYVLVEPTDSMAQFKIDPVCGRIIQPAGQRGRRFRVDYHYGFSSRIGAGAYERRVANPTASGESLSVTHVSGGGAKLQQTLLTVAETGSIIIDDSLTYTDIADLPAVRHVEVRADNKRRPLIRPKRPNSTTTQPASPRPRWVFTGLDGAVLVLDGLFVSGADIVLSGSFESVTVRCCTLDPGNWKPATMDRPAMWADAADGRTLDAAHLRIEGTIKFLVVERSIVGPILDAGLGSVQGLLVRDSIIQAAQPGTNALTLTTGEVALVRTTILGPSAVHRLSTSECLLHDVSTVEDSQHGSMRFSAWSSGSRVPRRYECVMIPPRAGLFTTQEYAQPGFAQLLATVSGEITQGAQDGSEMGAFASEKSALKERSLLIKYQEFLPLGLEPVIVQVT